MSAALRTWWCGRAWRERVVLLAGSGLLLAALVYVLALEPLIAAGRQAERALPELRRQAAELRGLAAEAAQLAPRAKAPASPVGLPELNAGLAAAGLVGRAATQGQGVYAVQLEAVSMTALLDWLEKVQRGQRLAVRSARLQAAGEGRASGQLVLSAYAP